MEKLWGRKVLVKFLILIHLAEGSRVRDGILFYKVHALGHQSLRTKPLQKHQKKKKRCGGQAPPLFRQPSLLYFKMQKSAVAGSFCVCAHSLIQEGSAAPLAGRACWENPHYWIKKEWPHADSSPQRDAPLPGRATSKRRKKHPSPKLRNPKLQSVFPSQRDVKLDIFINSF